MRREKPRGDDRLSWYAYFPADFEEGTSDFTLEQVGAYQRLMNSQWAKTGIPGDNIVKIAAILRVSTARARQVWVAVSSKFVRGADGLWRNQRLEMERERAIAASERASNNGSKGAIKRWRNDGYPNGYPNGGGNSPAMATAMATPMATPMANASLPQWQNDSSPDLDPEDLIKERLDLPPIVPPRGDSLKGRFDSFWQEYPKKVARGAAWRVWERLKPSAELTSQMLDAIRHQRASKPWREGFVPNPTTWLNGERWSDELEIQADRSGPMPFWDECAKCGDIHPVGQPCPPKVGE